MYFRSKVFSLAVQQMHLQRRSLREDVAVFRGEAKRFRQMCAALPVSGLDIVALSRGEFERGDREFENASQGAAMFEVGGWADGLRQV